MLPFSPKSVSPSERLVRLATNWRFTTVSVGGEKLDRFFTELGAPRPRGRGEKPGRFFTMSRLGRPARARPKCNRTGRQGDEFASRPNRSAVH
jgi:hypothetical protein